MSNQATGKLNAARSLLGIQRRLQSIGKTRFATIYYAAISVLENLPALYKIYSEGNMDIAANPLSEIVAEVMDTSQPAAIEFKLKLTELINILEPLARAILCLESTCSTISDVYFFWLSALASLNRLFCSKTTTLTANDKSRLQAIIYYRFSEAINEAPTDSYITAFFLDPRYRTALIYLDSSDFHAPQTAVFFGDTGRSSARRGATRPGSRLTGNELMVGQKRPGHPLYQYDALRAKTELTIQLQQYHPGLPSFRQFTVEHESVLEYWISHKNSHFTFILLYLCEKLFSVLPNSMCDERAGSRLAHMYSKLCTQLDVHSMIQQVQFSQFMAMKKSTPRSRFYEVKQECVAEYTSVNASEDCPVALTDEPGGEWLETQETNVAGHTTYYASGQT
ncbi:hypothetical protein RhiLY_01376 [Ceratobasidium sp. AG-Ba]|nr:hypothetical protein RhiLY_01376 [Ceratobasidium sp. AG-Ba]